jgi:drug/metabolite transporter (DMT)-like permease
MHPPDRSARDHARRGVFFALVAATLFGISAPFSKLLLHDAKPQLFAGLLYLGSGTGLALLWLARRTRGRSKNSLTRRDVPWLAGAILCGGVLAPLCLITGIALTPASTASLLLNLEAVFTAGLAWFVFGEQFHGRIALGMLVIIAGGVVLSWGGQVEMHSFAGPLLVAASTFCWGLDNNLTQRISSGDALQLGTIKGLVAGSVNTGLALALGATWPGAAHLAGILALGLACYGASLVLFVLALRHIGAARTGASFSIAPFVATAASLIVFRERPSMAFTVAAVLMAIGVWLLVTETAGSNQPVTTREDLSG